MKAGARRGERGITYVEVVATATILGVLAMAILPTAKAGQRRAKEIEYRRALRDIHDCVDQFKMRTQAGMGQMTPPGDGKVLPPKDPPYPEKLEDLVKGVGLMNSANNEKWRCLRSIPQDPITETNEWHLYCHDGSESDDSCRQGIWRVATKSDAMSLDGKTRYKEW